MIKSEDIPLWKHLQVFTTPRFERDFFRCNCYHLSLEHEINGRCRHPDCKCEKLSGIAFSLEITIPIHHRKVPDKEFWKQVENDIKKRFGGFDRNATNTANNAPESNPKFRWGSANGT